MFVRNPGNRIASVYSHKFTNFPESRPFKRKFGPAILNPVDGKYRDVPERELKDDPAYEDREISFANFSQYIVHMSRKNLNEHWMPAHELCHPCAMKYDYIGKFEELPDSARDLLAARKLDELVSYPDQTLFYRSQPFQQEESDKLIESLPRRLRHQLQLQYGFDYELFGYPLLVH